MNGTDIRANIVRHPRTAASCSPHIRSPSTASSAMATQQATALPVRSGPARFAAMPSRRGATDPPIPVRKHETAKVCIVGAVAVRSRAAASRPRWFLVDPDTIGTRLKAVTALPTQ